MPIRHVLLVALAGALALPAATEAKQQPCPAKAGVHTYRAFVVKHLRHGKFLHTDERRYIVTLDRCLPGPKVRRQAHKWFGRYWEAQHVAELPMSVSGNTSWFDDSGAIACGTHYALGFASRTGACGARVRFCNGSRCVVGQREDYGPATWTGRIFDLGAGLKNSLGCGDICSLGYRWL